MTIKQSKLFGRVTETGPDPIVMKDFFMISKQLVQPASCVIKNNNNNNKKLSHPNFLKIVVAFAKADIGEREGKRELAHLFKCYR